MLQKHFNHPKTRDGLWQLPKDWEWKYLEEVAIIHDGSRKPVKKGERVPGLIPYCGANGVIDSVAGWTHEGDFVLLAEDGGLYGSGEASAYRMNGKFWANNHVHILRGLDNVLDNDWLLYALNILNLKSFLTGTTRPKLTQAAMRKVLLPVPSSLDIQLHIISRIESLLAEVKESRNLLNLMYRDTKQVINAALDEVFKTVVVERASAQLASQILHITSGSRNWSQYSSPSNNGALFIRAGNVGFACIDLSEIERLSLPPNIDQKRARVNSGDVLVTITGAKVGHCCVVPDKLERAYVNQHVALIRLREKLEPRYLMWFILSPSGGIPQISAMQYGQTKPGLNLTNLRNLSIPIPGKSEQYQIISYLDSIQLEVDKMLKLLAQDTKSLAQLEQSILERAFRGEL